MTTVQIRRTPTPGNQPAPNSLAEGELAVDMAEPIAPRLWVGVPTAIDPTGLRLVSDMSQSTGDFVPLDGTLPMTGPLGLTDGIDTWTIGRDGTVPGTLSIISPRGDEKIRILPAGVLSLPLIIGDAGHLIIGGTGLSFMSETTVGQGPEIFADDIDMSFRGRAISDDYRWGFSNGNHLVMQLSKETGGGARLLMQALSGEDVTIQLSSTGANAWELISQSLGSNIPGAFTFADSGERRLNIHPATAGVPPIDLLTTGELILALDPTSPMGAVTKQYADAISAGTGTYVPLDGSLPMTGGLEITLPSTHNGMALVIDGSGTPTYSIAVGISSDVGEWRFRVNNAVSLEPGSFEIVNSASYSRFRILPHTGALVPPPVVIDEEGALNLGSKLTFAGNPGVFPFQPLGPSIWVGVDDVRFETTNRFRFFSGTDELATLYTERYTGSGLAHLAVGGTISVVSRVEVTGSTTATGDNDASVNLGAGNDGWDLIGQADTGSLPFGFTIADAVTGTRRLNIHPGAVANSPPVEILATGELLLALDPTDPMGAVTKQYADALTSAGGLINWSVTEAGTVPGAYTITDLVNTDERFRIDPVSPTEPGPTVVIDSESNLSIGYELRFRAGLGMGQTPPAEDTPLIFGSGATMLYRNANHQWSGWAGTVLMLLNQSTPGEHILTVNGSITGTTGVQGAHLRSTNGDFSGLPLNDPTNLGRIATIIDSPTAAWGAPVTAGGGTNLVLAYDDGLAWRVFAAPSTGTFVITGSTDVGDNDATLSLVAGTQTWDLIAQSVGSSAPGAFTISDALTGTRRLIIDPGATDSDTAVRITDNGNLSIGTPGSPSRLYLQGGGGLVTTTFSGPMIVAFEGSMSIKAGHVNRASMYSFVDDIGAAIFSAAWRPDAGGADYMFRVPGAAANADTDLLVQFEGAETWQLKVDGNVTGVASPTIGDLTLFAFVQGPGQVERLRFPFSGGMTLVNGALTLAADPVNPMEAVTRQYLDSALAGATGGGAVISDTPPAAPTAGSLWFDSVNLKLCIYYDAQWVTV